MKEWTFYDRQTGRIVGNGKGSLMETDSYGLMAGHFESDSYYIHVGQGIVMPRPDMMTVVNKDLIKANSTDEAIISNIPSGAVCTHDGEEHVITDGMIEFTAENPGTYTFSFELFPYKPVTINVEAAAP